MIVVQSGDHAGDRGAQGGGVAGAEDFREGGPVGVAVPGQGGQRKVGPVGAAPHQVLGVGGEGALQQRLRIHDRAAVIVVQHAEVRLPERFAPMWAVPIARGGAVLVVQPPPGVADGDVVADAGAGADMEQAATRTAAQRALIMAASVA